MRLIRNLFSFEGRISRQQFWLGHATIFACSVIFAMIAGIACGIASVALDLPKLMVLGPLFIGATVSLVALVAETSLAVRRMHDRGGSAIRVMPFISVIVLLNVTLTAQRFLYGEPIFDTLTVALTVVAILLGGWMMVELGFLSGTRGKNRFGDSPDDTGTADDADHVGAAEPVRIVS